MAIAKRLATLVNEVTQSDPTYFMNSGEYYNWKYTHSHAKGGVVPYDNYIANLHRGEVVLTASQARNYQSGGSNVDFDAMEARIAAAIKAGMENATVRSYLNGRDITQEVNRENMKGVKARRFAT